MKAEEKEVIEKAKELFAKYRFALSIPNAPLGESKDRIAKQCAIICCDEIINQYLDETMYTPKYYIEVIKEIKEL